MRQWAGITDMTPDYSPIMGLSPVKNYYLDAGWGTWGFKATPICGKTMAELVASGGKVPELIKPFALERFDLPASQRNGRHGGQPLRSTTMKIMTCPSTGRATSANSPTAASSSHARPGQLQRCRMGRLRVQQRQPRRVVREWWMHNASSYWFLAERHTVSDESCAPSTRKHCSPPRRLHPRRQGDRRMNSHLAPRAHGPADRPRSAAAFPVRRPAAGLCR
jgi:sarcosine oxidase subunit beta